MLRIRLTRVGKKNQPMYRIVVADHRRPVKGKFIEVLGHYNPRSKDITVERDKVASWIAKGAQTTPTVAALLKRPEKAAIPKAEAAPEKKAPSKKA